MPPVFILITDLSACHPDWQAAMAQADALLDPLTAKLGFIPCIRLASLTFDPGQQREPQGAKENLADVLIAEAETGASDIFLLPTMLDFGLMQKAQLAEIVSSVRQQFFYHTTILYDDVDPTHPLLVQAFVERLYQRLADVKLSPRQLGLLLIASGDGDSDGRAQSYRLMRLLWEELGCARGEVGFLRHAEPWLPDLLERCAREPLTWVMVPQMGWRHASHDDARAICEAFRWTGSEVRRCITVDPIGVSPLPRDRDVVAGDLSTWLQQRIVAFWQAKREKIEVKTPSAKRGHSPQVSRLHGPGASRPLAEQPAPWDAELSYGAGSIAEIYDGEGLAHLLRHLWAPDAPPTHVFVKVTWHGYAPGTYTDPVALDALLSALPGQAILVEGHTSSRNLGGATWDWVTESRAHRRWIAEQDAEYLRRTGLAEVIRKHKAQYLNVTEAWWDGQCAPQESVEAMLQAAGVHLHFPALAAYVPAVFLAHRGAPFLSFARFKGPTRLSIANMFGLIPAVLRTAWHGPDIVHFARVCCDMAKIYGCLFQLCGMAESLHVAVRWHRQGLYRSRWGNYDLVPHPGLVTLSRGLPIADVLASRLQGRQVQSSAFFQVVHRELGFPDAIAHLPIPEDLVLRLV